MWGLGFRLKVWGLGFGVWGLGFGVGDGCLGVHGFQGCPYLPFKVTKLSLAKGILFLHYSYYLDPTPTPLPQTLNTKPSIQQTEKGLNRKKKLNNPKSPSQHQDPILNSGLGLTLDDGGRRLCP